jgi:hypothetical protein
MVPGFLPFMSCLCVVAFKISNLLALQEFDFFFRALSLSPQLPATLEHIILNGRISHSQVYAFVENISALAVWTQLDGLVALPACS